VMTNKLKRYADVRAVCSNCARAAGFVRKDKVVGVWMDECGICHKHKPCTNLWHDWAATKEVEA